MGKSPTTCFKILACGADSTEIDDDDPSSQSQNKQSSDRRKWSFRKKSARHQNITVISEPQSVDSNKDNSQAIPDNFYAVKDSSAPQKSLLIEKENEAIASAVTYSEASPPVAKTDEVEVPLPSAGVNLEIPPVLEHLNEKTPLSSVEFSSELTGDVSTTKTTTFNDANQLNETTPFASPLFYSEVTGKGIIKKITSTEDANIQEANMAIVIQSAVRRYLAQRKLRKLRDVVKLQAVVRGHLVRKQAIGTLRCVQAIVKLQTLVRARRARRCHLLDKITGKEKHDQTVKRNSDLKPNKTNSTVDKLLANGFARLLLESTANTKTIHITCDPLKNDSAWQWLERWMAVTSSTEGNLQELDCQDYQEAEKHNNTAYEELHVAPVSDAPFQLSDSKFSLGISTNTEGEEVSEMHNSVKFESEAPEIVSDQCLSFTTKGDREQSLNEEDLSSKEENTVTVKGKEISCITAPSAFDNKTNSADFVSAFGSVEAEGKKSDTGSKKVRNPAFAAVQAKFEELSSAPKSSSRSINFVGQDAAIESKPNHSMIDSVKKNNDLSFTENSSALAQNPMIQVAASECGTEISISSTLDSPDRSEPDGGEIVLEIGNSGKINQNMINDANNTFNLQTESRQHSTVSNELQGQRIMDNNENVSNANSPGDKIKVERQPAEATTPGISDQKENLQKTPRNHVTAPESHGTPSSQASSQAKPSKTQNSVPPQKPKSTKSVSKSSPSNRKNNSGDRSSTEQHLPKDAKNAKSRSSFGMAKPDHVDNEPRRSSSNSLPSYMQATESARAKAHGSISLKSSPDVHDKENHTTKRHSFPIEDEKQGSSPRVQRSTSQTQQSLKGNSTHSPHNSAERRWQR